MNSEITIKNLSNLEKDINYNFKDKSYLKLALVHSSYSNENIKYKNKHNERLEFLGDAVLELVFSEELFTRFKNKNEGYLTKVRSQLVCEKSFASVADSLDLSSYLLLGKGEEATGGRNKNSIKADAFEALCGALYLDGGYKVVKDFIIPIIDLLIKQIDDQAKSFVDYKTIIQEYFHKNKNKDFLYELYKEEGLSHDKTFYINLVSKDKVVSQGFGKNKKQAEQMAAKNALIKYGVINE